MRDLSRQRSVSTIRNRKTVVMIMARHFTAEGVTDPCQVTEGQLNRYLLRQYGDRKPGGRVAFYQAVRVFWGLLAQAPEQVRAA